MHRLLRRVFTQPVRAAAGRRPFLPIVVRLEDRTTPATFTVTTNADTGAGSLRDAVGQANAAAGADIVVFAAGVTGTIGLATGQISITDAVTITGPGAGVLTVANTQAAGPTSRVFTTDVVTAGDVVTISGLRLTGGNATTNGGGINNVDADLRLVGTVVTNNVAAVKGGGVTVAVTAGKLTLTDSVVSNNVSTTSDGGGINIQGNSPVTVVRSTISGNTAADDGAGIYFYSGGTLTMTDSTVSGNVAGAGAGADGGGIYFFATTGTVTNSTISGNKAGRGGAMAIKTGGDAVTISNTTITANVGLSTGTNASGGITRTAAATGTGVTRLVSTIVAGNTGGVANGADVSIAGNALAADFSLIRISDGLTIAGANNKLGTAAAPLNPVLTGLQNNGGPTLTHALLSSSPALNAGSNPLALPTDQRGAGFPRVLGAQADIGATEGFVVVPSATLGSAPNVTTPGATTYTFTVVYAATSPALINVSTLGTGDVTVTGPAGAITPVTFVSASPNTNSGTVTATYTFAAPGGTFGMEDNGTYTIAVAASQVADTAGLQVTAGTIGTFAVAIPLTAVVTNLDNAGAGSLRQAILDTNAAPTADIITFQPGLTGTITVVSELLITGAVTIAGPGAGVITVSGNSVTRVFNVNSPVAGAAVNVSGLTVAAGKAVNDGGGFLLPGDEYLNLDRVVVTGNTTGPNSQGGGIFVGGPGAVQLVNSTVSGNTATLSGGGVYFYDGGALNIVGSTVSGNTSGGGVGGGGVYFYGAASTAPPAGFTAGALTVTNSTISGNTSATNGGGIVANAFTGTLRVRNSTVALNSAGTGGGGGIALATVPANAVILENSVVSGNTNSKAPDVFTLDNTVVANFSLIGVQTGLIITGANNLAGDAKLGPLQNNGGPTLTHLPLAGSPLINAGSNALIPAGVTDDQRPDFPRITGPSVDIGATEFGSVGLGRVASFTPVTAGPINTPAAFNLTFSNPIAGLSAANFDLAPGAPAGSTVAVTGSGTTYTVTVTVPAGTQGTVTPRLIGGAGVTPGLAGTLPVSASAGTFVDRIVPTVTAFTRSGPALTNAATVSYTLTFSESVTLTPASFAAGPSGPPTVTGSGASYTVTFGFPAGFSAAFTPTIAVAPADPAGNPIALPAAGPAVTVDRLAPTVLSVNRAGGLRTSASSVTFVVTFSEPIDSALTAANFSVVSSGLGGSVAVTGITGTGTTRTVTVSTGTTGDGRVRLDFTSGAGVADPATNPLSLPAAVTGQDYIVLRSPAVLSIEPTGPLTTNAATADFLVTFNQPIGGLTASNFSLLLTNGATGTPVAGAVTGVVTSGSTATVTVSGITGTGGVRLDFANGNGTTPAVNDVPGLGPVPFAEGTPIQVDRDLPGVVSLTRTGPPATNALTVSYVVTFSEPVLGLTTANFAATQGIDPATVTGVTGSGTTFTVTVATNNSNGVLGLTLTTTAGVADPFTNPATGAPLAAETTRVFRVPPRVLSIALAGPVTTSAPFVTFVVTFTQPVTGVTAANFALAATVAGSQLVGFAPVAGDPSKYTVTASTGSGDGTLALSLVAPAGIVDEVNQPVTNTTAGPAYTIRKSPVTATAVELVGPPVTNDARGSFIVRFTEAVSGFDASDLVVSGPAGSGVVGFAPFNDGSPGAAYRVEVAYGTADGVVRVDLIDDGSITATATGLPLAGPADGGVRGPMVTVDRTGPVGVVTLAPGQAATVTPGTVTFALNYSEPVTGVANNLQIAANGVTYTAFTVSGTGTSYTVTFAGVAGRGTLTLNGAAATDRAGNTSPPSAGATVTVAPAVVVPPPPPAVAPVASADAARTVLGKPVSGNVLTNDSGPGLSAALVTGPTAAQGRVTVGADGAFTFTPAANFTGTATFTYAARSSNGLTSAPATVTVTVTGRTHFLAVGAGEGGGPVATVYNPDGSPRRSFFAYEDTFRGGVRVATGDVTGDGVDDIITTPGRTGGPRVRVFDGVTGAVVYDFFAYSEQFTGGVYVASADVDGDGFADIVTGAGAGGGPHIQVFSGKTGQSIRSFFAYVPDFAGGVQVAAGDLDGDGQADIVVGAATGGPHVQAFDGKTGNQVRNFFAFDPTSAGGVTVAVGDINGDGFADIITGSGADARTRVYDGRLPALLAEQGLNIPFLVGGVRVAAKDTTGDNVVDVIAVTPAGGATPVLRRFSIVGLKPLVEASPFDPSFFGGLYVG